MTGSDRIRIGLMGGTFDPIHFGHLYIAECSRYRFGLEKILFIPAGEPVHKNRADISAPEHRLRMTELAVRSNPSFEISTMEIRRSGPTYTVDTLRELQKKDKGEYDYFFITGADAILEILTWKNVDEVFRLCEFIAVTRPGYSLEGMNRVTERLTGFQRERIHIHETGGTLVSSTDIRRRVARGEPIKYLVPEAVEQYIYNNRLYL